MTRRWRWSGALITAVLAVGLIAEPAGAKVTFSGIGGVKLGMSEDDVRDALGPASSEGRWRDRQAVILSYRRRKIEVLIDRQADRVMGVKTASRAQRTSSGLGVGSSEHIVRWRLRGEKCGGAQGTRVCSVERDGGVLDFDIRRGKVIRVSVTLTG
jgi:hypothetical protein